MIFPQWNILLYILNKWNCQLPLLSSLLRFGYFYYRVDVPVSILLLCIYLILNFRVTALKPKAVLVLLILCIVAGPSALEFLEGGC